MKKLIDFDVEQDAKEVQQLNPLGALPIAIINGKTMTQNIAILEYIADQNPGSPLLPQTGTWERTEVMRWLSFTASDLHKAFSPLFGLKQIFSQSSTQIEVRQWSEKSIHELLAVAENQLNGKEYLTGSNFTIADAYFYVVVSWTKWVDISISKYKNLESYMRRVTERPAVAKTLKEAGLA